MVTTTKSLNVTALEAQPFTVLPSRIKGGSVKAILDTVEQPNTTSGDYIIMSPLPVDATLISVKYASDDAGATGTTSLGFYKKNNDGTYTVVSAAAIASAIDNSGAAVALTEYRFSVLNIDTVRKAIWELAGLSARPAYPELFIGITPDGNDSTIATGTVILQYME
jgi:hypothetical protein